MVWRLRLGALARALLACAALQLSAVPAATASARPVAALSVQVSAAPREQAESATQAPAAHIVGDDRGQITPRSRNASQPAGTTEARVLIERLYLRLLSIRC